MTLHKVLHKFVIALKRAKLASCSQSTGENTKQRLHTFPPFSRGSWGRKKTKNELRVITRSLPDLMSQTTARSYKKHISTIPCQSNNKLSFVWPRFAQTTIKAAVARWLRHCFGGASAVSGSCREASFRFQSLSFYFISTAMQETKALFYLFNLIAFFCFYLYVLFIYFYCSCSKTLRP